MVDNSGRSHLLEACGRLLIPVIRFLLKGGVSWKEFSETAKTIFVKVATEDFGIRGRPTNASRVAILTGLDRREVRRQREALKNQDAGAQGYMTKASQVLAGWHHNPEFRDSAGNPRTLSLEGGQGAPGFGELVRKYAPALPAVAMLKELKAASAVEELADGSLRALTRSYIPRHMPEEQVRLWSFTRAAGAPAVFERRAVNLNVDEGSLAEFKAFLEKEGQAFLLRVDDWLSVHEAKDHDVTRKVMRLGVGVYQIQDRPEKR
jgi:Family of unknown function (DUF6502)